MITVELLEKELQQAMQRLLPEVVPSPILSLSTSLQHADLYSPVSYDLARHFRRSAEEMSKAVYDLLPAGIQARTTLSRGFLNFRVDALPFPCILSAPKRAILTLPRTKNVSLWTHRRVVAAALVQSFWTRSHYFRPSEDPPFSDPLSIFDEEGSREGISEDDALEICCELTQKVPGRFLVWVSPESLSSKNFQHLLKAIRSGGRGEVECPPSEWGRGLDEDDVPSRVISSNEKLALVFLLASSRAAKDISLSSCTWREHANLLWWFDSLAARVESLHKGLPYSSPTALSLVGEYRALKVRIAGLEGMMATSGRIGGLHDAFVATEDFLRLSTRLLNTPGRVGLSLSDPDLSTGLRSLLSDRIKRYFPFRSGNDT